MVEKPISRKLQLVDDELESLDRRLAIAASKMQPMIKREKRGNKKIATSEVTGQEVEAIRSDIVENYRKGVNIASHAESRPLLPLYAAANIPVPPEIKVDHDKMQYDFYSVGVTFSSLLPSNQFAVFAELMIQINDDVKDSTRSTRPVRLFPCHKDKELFNVDFTGEIGLSAGLSYSPLPTGNAFSPILDAKVKADVSANLLMGPIRFQFRKAAIEVIGESDQNIVWRYNLKSELTGTNDFKSLLILKVGNEATKVNMSISLGVIPCKHKWLIFRDFLPKLSDQIDLPVELLK